ncbi:MAG TPA: hypothetical protein VK158_05525 [Acidobacteriota bacterium]|nr:hypothetical protein [Acidobacteriota bacterium]
MKHNPNVRVESEEKAAQPVTSSEVPEVRSIPGDVSYNVVREVSFRPGPTSSLSKSLAKTFLRTLAVVSAGYALYAGANNAVSIINVHRERDAESKFLDLHDSYRKTARSLKNQQQFLSENVAGVPSRAQLETLVTKANSQLESMKNFFLSTTDVVRAVTPANAQTVRSKLIPEKMDAIAGVQKHLADAQKIIGQKRAYDTLVRRFDEVVAEIRSFDDLHQYTEKLKVPLATAAAAQKAVSLAKMQKAMQQLQIPYQEMQTVKAVPQESQKVLESIVANAKEPRVVSLAESYHTQIQKLFEEKKYGTSVGGLTRFRQFQTYVGQQRVARIITLKSVRDAEKNMTRYAVVAAFVGNTRIADMEFPESVTGDVKSIPTWDEPILEQQFIELRGKKGPNNELLLERSELAYKHSGFMTYDRAYYRAPPSKAQPKPLYAPLTQPSMKIELK